MKQFGRDCRQPTPKDPAEQKRRARVELLAAEVLMLMQGRDRSYYDSERTLRGWLVAANVGFSPADLGPALASLEARGLIRRARVAKASYPRAAWLPETAEVQKPTYSSITRKTIL